jgi:selenium metabolism protein YedF
MKQVVDARGLACPQPVMLTSKAIAAAEQVTTIVDNPAAVENVTRLARSKGLSVEVSEKPDGTYLILRRAGGPVEVEATPLNPPLARGEQKRGRPALGATVVLVPSDCLGRGPVELGERLMAAFFDTLLGLDPKPARIILINAGVKLAVEGSPTLDELRALADHGTEILACGTCLSYFDLTDKLAVGRVSNMYEIVAMLVEAERILQL